MPVARHVRRGLIVAVCALAVAARLEATTLDACVTKTISAISVANPTVITTTIPHNLVNGQTVTLAGSNSTPTVNGARVATVTSATTFTVPVNVTVSGNAGTVACGTYSDLQTAYAAAASGDTITLRAGDLFTANTTFANKSNASVITIKSDASAGNLPGVGVRTSPAYAAFLPKLQAPAGGSPAIQFLASSQKITLENVEFLGNPLGYGEIINIGYGDSQQTLVSQEPNNVILDRLYIHGDPAVGQKRALALNGNNLTLKNSYISEIKGFGQDAQCFTGWNASGTHTITNNYCEAAGENFIYGGSDPWERVYLTVTGSATTTGAAVQIVETGHTLAELANGQLVAVETPTGVEFATLTAQPGSGTTGTLAWTPAVSAASAVGARVRGGTVAKNITITGNHFKKNVFWMTDGFLAKPSTPTATPSTSSGTLAAGQQCYRVQAYNAPGYQGSTLLSGVSNEVCATLPSAGHIDLAWLDITGETAWRAWRFATSGATTGQFIDLAANSTSFTDTGAIAWTSGTYQPASRPVVKNTMELKAAQSITISGNVFENDWKGSDIGYAVWLKSTNQDGGCWFCQSRDVTIEKNIWRHVYGWISFNGREVAGGSGNQLPPPLTNVVIQNNLVYDSNGNWGEGSNAYAMRGGNGTVGLTIQHNTVVHLGQGLLQIYGKESNNLPNLSFIFRNNLVRHEFYGILGEGSTGDGSTTLALQAPGYVFTNNAIADAPCGLYPATTLCEPAANWEAEFVSYSFDGAGNADYHLKTTSPYHNAATDGLDIGADINAITTATAGAVVGTSTSPPTITTIALPNAIRTLVYPSTTLTATGGTTPYTWAVNSGSTLPTGLTFSGAGVLAGTPTATAGSYTFTLKVTDNAALVGTKSFTISITNAVSITTSTLAAAEKDLRYSATLAATGDAAPYSWTCPGCVLPPGITLSTAGVFDGTPTTNGTYAFTVQVTGSLGSTSTQALSIVVSTETFPCGRALSINGSEARVYRRKSAPTGSDCAMKGDLWLDTSVSPPLIKIATATSPLTWALLSTSTGLVGDGSALTNLNAGELKNGTIPSAAFPNVFPGAVSFSTSVTTPITNTDYIAITEGPCATPSSAGTVRLCGGTDGSLKMSANGQPYSSVFGTASSSVTTTSPTGVSGMVWPVLTDENVTLWGANVTDGMEFRNFTRHRLHLDLTGYSQARVAYRASTAANAGALLCVEYSTNAGSTWTPLNGSTTGAGGICAPFDLASQNVAGAWGSITAAARGSDVILRLASYGGNGTIAPATGAVAVQFR